MFTGIIQEVAVVSRLKRSRGIIRLDIHAPKTAAKVRRLESVAINGVCLSVVAVAGETLSFEMIPETQKRTSLLALQKGTPVNVEPSLSLTDRLNGHFVFGHVDATGRVVRRLQKKGELVLWIQINRVLRRLIVPKGPVAVDGVSLTVGPKPTAVCFSIHLIPETLRQTTLGLRRAGDRVNLEMDYLAKLIRQRIA